METVEFAELAGRVEGVSRALLRLVDMLDAVEIIDRPVFSQGLRDIAEQLHMGTAHEPATKRTLQELASIG